MRFRSLPKEKIDKIPRTPGVYALRNNQTILYVGKAAGLRERIKNHFSQPTHRDQLFIGRVSRVGYIKTQSDIDALLLESQLIKRYQPKYNVLWKDDKKYFYVAVDPEGCVVGKEKRLLPRVYITHQPAKVLSMEYGVFRKEKRKNPLNTKYQVPSTKYVGPFVEGRTLKRVLRLLRRTFPYYTAKKHPLLPCPWCYIDLCPGTNPDGKTCQKNIKNLIEVLEGKRRSVLKKLEREMEKAAKEQRFEEAATLRDQFFSLQNIIAHASFLQTLEPRKQQRQELRQREIQKRLGKLFGSKRAIRRIEAYDISNIQGQEATGSMVVFKRGVPAKDQYRKFKIHIAGKPNDFAMLQELIGRRLSHREWEYPQFMLIDGGKGQLNAVLKALRKFKVQSTKSKINSKVSLIKIAAIAKRHNELFLPGKRKPLLLRDLPQNVSNLILHMRDEAHRFAVAYHRILRTKVTAH